MLHAGGRLTEPQSSAAIIVLADDGSMFTGTANPEIPGPPEKVNTHDPFASGVTITVEVALCGGVGELTSTTRVAPCVQLSLSVGADSCT